MPFSFQGSTITQPGVIAVKSSTGMSSPASSQRMVVLLGQSGGGGAPKTLHMLNGQQDASTKLRSGDLKTSAVRSYVDASSPLLAYMRVNPALQSTYNVLSDVTTVINLTSVDYGEYTKLISTSIVAGSVQGLKATVSLDGATYSQDNIYQALVSVQYTGPLASALLNVNNVSGTITGTAGAAGSETVVWTAPFSTYTTLQQLVNHINTFPGWNATVLGANPSAPTLNNLDTITNVVCKATPGVITATLQALIDWYNSTPLVTATRPALVGSLPTVMATPAYLSGGSDGTVTNTDWANVFSALQNVPQARIVVPVTADESIHAMARTHNNYMSDPTVRSNRISFVGGLKGETVTQVGVRSSNLNSRRVAIVYPGIKDTDVLTGQLITYDPYLITGQLATLFASGKITSALTRKAITAKGLEGDLQNTLQKSDYDNLSNLGVMALKFFYNENGSYFGVVRSLTTHQSDKNLDNIELSMVCNEDYVQMRVGDAQDALIGNDGSPVGAGMMQSAADSTLRDLEKEGAIVGDKAMPAYSDVVSLLSGQAVITTYKATIPAPMNFAGISANFAVYTKTA